MYRYKENVYLYIRIMGMCIYNFIYIHILSNPKKDAEQFSSGKVT